MQVADELIQRIVNESRIPSEKKRLAVLRELRSHVEDSILAAREAGHSDDEIRQLVLARFGDPGQIAQGFASVYRRDRIILRTAAFLLSSLAVASILSAVILALQAGLAISFGAAAPRMIASRHTVVEALDILFTVTAYLGFISIEKLFEDHRFQWALAILTVAFAIAAAGCAAANVHAPFLIFGFVSGLFLRTIRIITKSGVVQTGLALACFSASGILLFQVHPSVFRYAAMNCASWLVMGAGYQLMAGLAPQLDEVLSKGLQRI